MKLLLENIRKLGTLAIVAISVAVQSCSTLPSDTAAASLSGESADRLFVLVGQADAAYKQRQWDDASTLYQEVLSLVPEDPYAWFRLGNTLTQTGQYYKAIFAFETSLKHGPLQTKPWFNLSTAHLLGAQLATLRALASMDENDLARAGMQHRLNTLSLLLR